MPLIGITVNHIPHPVFHFPMLAVLTAYVQAVSRAGGSPVMLPLDVPQEQLDEIFSRLDGIVFTGGGDIAPEVYGDAGHPTVDGVDPDRDRVELHLARAAAQKGRPFLGICRGIQMVNVALGGTLYSHIADQHPQAIKHDYFPNWPREHLAHPVQIEPHSRLAHILGATELSVNSLHHQGVRQLAPGLRPLAYAPDGVLEAAELVDHPFGLAVQWHPEWLQAHEPMRALFRALVEAALG